MPNEFGFVPDPTSTQNQAAPMQSSGDFGFVPDGGKVDPSTRASSNGQSVGFLQSAAQSIAKPFLQFGRLPAGLMAEGAGALTGNKDLQEKGAAAASSQPYDFGYLGKVPAAGFDNNGNPLSTGGAIAQGAGIGAQLAPWFVGAGEAKPILSAGAKALEQAGMSTGIKTTVGAGTKILNGAAAGLGVGAAQGAGGELQNEAETGNGVNAGSVIGAGASGAIAGGITGGLLATSGALGSAILDNFSSNTGASRLAEQTNRLRTLQNALADSKTNPIETISDLGTPLRVVDGKVNTDILENTLDKMQGGVNDRARDIVANMPGTVNTEEFQSTVEDAIKKNSSIRGAGGVQKALGKVQTMFEDYARTYGQEMPYSAVNEIRTSMNRFFDPESVDVERAVANTARDYLYDSENGSPELKGLMAQWGKLQDAQNFAEKLRGTAVKGGRLGKIIADSTASVVGAGIGSFGGPLGAAAGAVGAPLAADKVMTMMQNSYFHPMLTAPASTISRFVGSPAIQKAASLGTQAAVRSVIPKP